MGWAPTKNRLSKEEATLFINRLRRLDYDGSLEVVNALLTRAYRAGYATRDQQLARRQGKRLNRKKK